MPNAFIELLKGEYKEPEIQISLKSTVPVFIAYPELIIPFKAKMTDIIPFYKDEYDYEDVNKNILLESGTSTTLLVILFTKIIETIITAFNSGDSAISYIPKVTLKVDIGDSTSKFEVISPSEEDVNKFDDAKSKMFTFTGFSAVDSAESLSYEQKHNLLLVDILTRKYNNSGLGGR